MDYNKPYLICCGVLKKEIERLIADGRLLLEPVYMDAGLHVDPEELKKQLVKTIDKCSADGSRAIIVVYGDLCHPNMKEIVGNYDNVTKVDALNCIDCLLGGHGRLCSIDPNWEYFYLSPGWLPSSLRESPKFNSFFNSYSDEQKKAMISKMKGVIIFDTLGDLDSLKAEIEEFTGDVRLPVISIKTVGLDGLRDVVTEAIQNHCLKT
jgi:hypothetical protein